MIYRNKKGVMTSVEPVLSSSSFMLSSQTNSCEEDICSSPELDVVSFTPGPQSSSSSADDPNNQKRYFCQRCLNHKLEFPRKGHKPFCRYAMCNCEDCMMVEYRRRLNNQLSQRRLDPEQMATQALTANGGKRADAAKKVRDPKCARCSAHGEKQALRGHKKALCPYLKCGCHLCNLVENRRTLMAKQIKLRRDQQKARKAQQQSPDNTDNNNDSSCGDEQKNLTQQLSDVKYFCDDQFVAPKNANNNSELFKSNNNDNRSSTVFARPFTLRNSERKRSYGSAIENEKPMTLLSHTSYSTNSSPILSNTLSPNLTSTVPVATASAALPTTITPMLLPSSLLYQQLCLQSQQQHHQQQTQPIENSLLKPLNELNGVTQFNTGVPSSLSGITNPTGLTHSIPSSVQSNMFCPHPSSQLNLIDSNNKLNKNSVIHTQQRSLLSFGALTANLKAPAMPLNLEDAQKRLTNSMLLVNAFAPPAPLSISSALNMDHTSTKSLNTSLNNVPNALSLFRPQAPISSLTPVASATNTPAPAVAINQQFLTENHPPTESNIMPNLALVLNFLQISSSQNGNSAITDTVKNEIFEKLIMMINANNNQKTTQTDDNLKSFSQLQYQVLNNHNANNAAFTAPMLPYQCAPIANLLHQYSMARNNDCNSINDSNNDANVSKNGDNNHANGDNLMAPQQQQQTC